VNLAASLAATEALKLLIGAEDRLRQTLFSFAYGPTNGPKWAAKLRVGCRACGQRDFVYLAGAGRPHITLCGATRWQIHERHRPVDLAEMSQRLQPHGAVRHTDFVAEILAGAL